jgi:hypothetical protein
MSAVKTGGVDSAHVGGHARRGRRHGVRRAARPGATLAAVLVSLSCVSVAGQDERLPGLVQEQRQAVPPDLPFTATALAWIDQGRVAFINATDRRIEVLDLHGGAWSHLGSEGGGPGELALPISLVANSARVYVADARTLRISEFALDSGFVRSQPIPGLPLEILRVEKDTVVLTWLRGPRTPVLGTVNLATGERAEMFEAYAADPALATPNPITGAPSPFLIGASGPAGTYVMAQRNSYRLTAVTSTGRIEQSFSRPDVEPEPMGEDEIDRLGRAFKTIDLGNNVPAHMRADLLQRARAQPKPFLTDAVTDASGRLWVITGRGAGATELDVFAPSGEYVGTLTVKDRVKSLSIRGRHLVALLRRVEHDDIDGIDFYTIDPPARAN